MDRYRNGYKDGLCMGFSIGAVVIIGLKALLSFWLGEMV